MLKASQRIEELKNKHATMEKNNEQSKKRERELRENRVDTKERREKLARLENEKARKATLSQKNDVLKVLVAFPPSKNIQNTQTCTCCILLKTSI